MIFCLFSSGMLVLLTKTLTSHVYCESLTFPSEKGRIVLLGIRVHPDPPACLWEALPSSFQIVGEFIPRSFHESSGTE